ncbi:MAG: hypothetical protein NVS3B10_14350 [Polyangiales bacterium]
MVGLAGCSAATDAAGPHDSGPVAVRYVTRVVSFVQGEGGGKNADRPVVVEGPPVGAGSGSGSSDTLSLGNGGEIVVAFDGDVGDGPGPDLVVYENPFFINGDPTNVFYELGEVSVSDDGATWTAFPCAATALPFEGCSGWRPVYATPARPPDPAHLDDGGGEAFDLATLGLHHAKFVRIRDLNTKRPACCGVAGFDLDAVAVLH